MAPRDSSPDLERARRGLVAGPPPGKVVLSALGGNRAYGFPARDEPLELKGIHLSPGGAAAWARVDDLLDVSSFETGHAWALLCRGDGSVLERIFSPWQVGPAPGAVQTAARGVLSRRFHHHYRATFDGMCRMASEPGALEAAPLLHAYRAALTGAHLLGTGEVLLDLTELAPRFGFGAAVDLAGARAGEDRDGVVSADEHAFHRSEWHRLHTLLEEALAASPLPAEPVTTTPPVWGR